MNDTVILSLSLSIGLQQPFGPWPLFQFLNLYKASRTPWSGDQPVARPLSTRRTTQTQNKCTQTSMPRVGFEPTIPVFEQEKTVHASDRAATVIGGYKHSVRNARNYQVRLSVWECNLCWSVSFVRHAGSSASPARCQTQSQRCKLLASNPR
jgi:hypothetical protein